MVLYYCDSGILSLLGIAITGNEAPLTLGMSARLSCATDLAPVVAVEWLYGGAVIAQSLSDSAQLVFPAVNDTLHNRQYTCRTSTAYGVQERNTTITVSGIFCTNSSVVDVNSTLASDGHGTEMLLIFDAENNTVVT